MAEPRRIWLDHNAGTAPDPRVLARFVELESRGLGNPASLHARGRAAQAIVEEARATVAQVLAVHDDEVVFVSGGTEANNLVVLGAGDLTLPVLSSEVEHPSCREPAQRRGVVLWELDQQGRARVRPPDRRVGLVALVHAQSEIGAVQDVEGASRLARSLGVPFHVDAAQSLGRLPVRPVVAVADTVAFALHKAGGLRGQSVLIVKRAVRDALLPRTFGGGQEHGLRPGTQSPALAAATAFALELAVQETEQRAAALRSVRDAFLARLGLEHVVVLTREPALPNTALVLLAVRDGRALVPALDLLGVEASQGSACASGAALPPRLLLAMGHDEETARRAVRFSFGIGTTIPDACEAADRVRGFLTRENRRREA